MFEVDGEQLTPLDYAVIGQHQELAQLLIENGALTINLVRDLAAVYIQKVSVHVYTCQEHYICRMCLTVFGKDIVCMCMHIHVPNITVRFFRSCMENFVLSCVLHVVRYFLSCCVYGGGGVGVSWVSRQEETGPVEEGGRENGCQDRGREGRGGG